VEGCGRKLLARTEGREAEERAVALGNRDKSNPVYPKKRPKSLGAAKRAENRRFEKKSLERKY